MNLLAYLNERFAPINMGLFAILFATVAVVAGHYFPQTEPSWGVWLGVLPTISFFFRLRVFDEIKDFDLDMMNHPHRVLQSGRVTLPLLIRISLLGTLVEFLWSWWMGAPALVGWLMAVGYSLLMRYEFFSSAWLKPRLLPYALSHMAVMPLIILWLWWAFVPSFNTGLGVLLLGLLAVLGGFSFELARKIHAPYAERTSIDSYSQVLGYQPAILAVLGVLLLGIGILAVLLGELEAHAWPYYLMGGLFLATAIFYAWLAIRPEERGLRKAEKLVSLFMLISYVAVLVEG